VTNRNSNAGAPPILTWFLFMGIFVRTHTNGRAHARTHARAHTNTLVMNFFFLSCLISSFRRDVIEIFAVLGCYAVLDGSLLRTVSVLCYSVPPSQALHFRLHCCCEIHVLCLCAKSTNKNVNFAICRYNVVRALNKRVNVYAEILLRLSKGYRGNLSEKKLVVTNSGSSFRNIRFTNVEG
jgi:hypothetical protein